MCFLGIPHPSTFPSVLLAWGSRPPHPRMEEGEADGWEALSLHREWDGAGPWGGDPGLWGWGAAAAGREGEGLSLLCAATLPFTHTCSGWDASWGVSPGPPVLAWAASHHQGGQDEALLLLPLPRSGMEGTELQTRCCHRTPRGARYPRLPGEARLKTGDTTGQQQQHQGCSPPRQPDPSPRAASSKPCPCGMEVPGPLAGADSGHGAERGAIRGASRGPPAPGHCSAVTSPLLLS